MSGFIQVRHFAHTFGVMRRSFRREHGGISSFEAYCTSLGARVGTGNLAGVAVALELGGPGAVFWMWVTAMLGMATSFFESTLAQLFKVPNDDGSYRGGPAFYMQYGLGKRWMGILFSIVPDRGLPDRVQWRAIQFHVRMRCEQVTGIGIRHGPASSRRSSSAW
jgi:alanine or glycine:cation symporter, AGCS family